MGQVEDLVSSVDTMTIILGSCPLFDSLLQWEHNSELFGENSTIDLIGSALDTLIL